MLQKLQIVDELEIKKCIWELITEGLQVCKDAEICDQNLDTKIVSITFGLKSF